MHGAHGQAAENRDVIEVIPDRLDPASDRRLLIFEPGDLSVAAVENAGGQ